MQAVVASDISETSEETAINFNTVTASVMIMHQLSMCLTLAFIQGHTHLNHGQLQMFDYMKSVQAMPIEFAAKIARLKVYMIFAVRLP